MPAGGSDVQDLLTWYNLGVANLPSGPIKDDAALQKRQRLQYKFLDEMIDAQTDYRGVALQLAKGDERKAKRWRQRWRTWIQEPTFQEMMATIVMGELRAGLGPSVQALVRRASKGNIPAIKLAMEASGFHNPRMDHHHSGKIEIEFKGTMRPPAIVDESKAEPIVDVTVVEE